MTTPSVSAGGFLKLFFRDDERICFRTFPPKGVEGKASKHYGTIRELQNGRGLLEELAAKNRKNGIYSVINYGGDSDAEIVRYNACFAESDTHTFEEQHRKLDACPLPTTARAQTARSVHAYWRLHGDVDRANWIEVQNRLIAYLGGDTSIKNPSRVMRLPGFGHIAKEGTRTPVRVVQFDPERTYTIVEMLAAFPAAPRQENMKTDQGSNGGFATWDALRAELGRRIIAHETARKNAKGNWDCRGICHDGEGNTGLFYNPSTNQVNCNSKCDQPMILRAFGLPVQPSNADNSAGSDSDTGTPTDAIGTRRIPPGGIILPSDYFDFCESAKTIFPVLAKTGRFFMRGNSVVELIEDGLRVLTPEAFVSRLDRFSDRVFGYVIHNGELVLKDKRCTLDKAKALLATLEAVEMLPPIRLVTRSPVIIQEADRTIVLREGYHSQCGGILVITKVEPPLINIREAAPALRALLADFLFMTPGDESRALAAMVTPALVQGGWIKGFCPVDVGEADHSQAGKGYRNKITHGIYSEKPYQVTVKIGGVGSFDESLGQALLSGRPFISLDNLRGRLDSQYLESVITWGEPVSVRVPHRGEVQVDATAVTFQLTSNGVETTRDTANRSSICRIRKQPEGYRFSGDALGAVTKNPSYYLGCVFAVIRAWAEAGCPQIDNPQHDFRVWAGSLGWIVENIFETAPLMDGHQAAQVRVSSPALVWLRRVCLAAEKDGRLDQQLSASAVVDICNENDIDLPGLRPGTEEKQARQHVGTLMKQCYRTLPGDRIEVDGFAVDRTEEEVLDVHTRNNRMQRRYKICTLHPAHPAPITPKKTDCFPENYMSRVQQGAGCKSVENTRQHENGSTGVNSQETEERI